MLARYSPLFEPGPALEALTGQPVPWAGITAARPLYADHAQPAAPGRLGYYDPRVAGTLAEQMRLAADHGLSGFVLDHYLWDDGCAFPASYAAFAGMAEAPLPVALGWPLRDAARAARAPVGDLPGPAAADRLAGDIARLWQAGRAVLVDDRPLLVLRQLDGIEDVAGLCSLIAGACTAQGMPAPWILLAGADGERGGPAPWSDDLRGAVLPGPAELARLDVPADDTAPDLPPGLAGRVLAYETVALDCLRRGLAAGRPLWLPVGADTTPVAPDAPLILQGSGPEPLGIALETALRGLSGAGSDAFVLLDAWNDWHQGAVLEPDGRLGDARLRALRLARARAALPPLPEAQPGVPALAVILHVYYTDVAADILDRLARIDTPFRLYVTCRPGIAADLAALLEAAGLAALLEAAGLAARIFETPNRGRDILPFLTILPEVQAAGHACFLKLHTKKSPHRQDGADWSDDLLDQLCDPATIAATLRLMADDPGVGLAGPRGHALLLRSYLMENEAHVLDLIRRMQARPAECAEQCRFIAGSMVFGRFAALGPLMRLGLSAEDFEPEDGQLDGTLAHAVERTMVVSCRQAGLRMALLDPGEDRPAGAPAFYQDRDGAWG